MLRRVPRALRVAVLGTVLLAVLASIAQSWTNSTPGAGGYVQTQWGPLGPADRNLLIAVRLAGLWEGPTGESVANQGSAEEVRQVGANLGVEHSELNRITLDYASQLGVQLPSSPNATQMGWMNEIASKTGTDYDRTFVQITREAHGSVLPVIAEVRAGTRNELVRRFAEEANAYVTRHIGYLESTGLVDYQAMPEPPSPGLLSADRGPFDLIVPGLVVLAALLAAAGLLSALRRRPRPAPDSVLPGGPPVTGRAIAAIAAAPAAPAARSARSRVPVPRPAVTTDSGAYQITATPEPEPVAPGYAQGEYAPAEYAQGGYAQGEYAQAEYAQPDYATGYNDVRYADAEYADTRYAGAEYGPDYTGPRYADAAPAGLAPEEAAERTGPLPRSRRSRSRHSVRT